MARLGNDLAKVYPDLGDCEDDEKLQELFCFVFAKDRGYLLRRLQVLRPNQAILELFSDATLHPCLLLHTKQQDHKLDTIASVPTNFGMNESQIFSPYARSSFASSAFNSVDGYISDSLLDSMQDFILIV